MQTAVTEMRDRDNIKTCVRTLCHFVHQMYADNIKHVLPANKNRTLNFGEKTLKKTQKNSTNQQNQKQRPLKTTQKTDFFKKTPKNNLSLKKDSSKYRRTISHKNNPSPKKLKHNSQ